MEEEYHYDLSSLLPGTFFIHGSFDRDLRDKFIQYLITNNDRSEIFIIIDSTGGRLDALVSMGNLLRLSGKKSTAIVIGRANSCAFFFVQHCHYRVATPGSTFVPHFGNIEGLSNSEIYAYRQNDPVLAASLNDDMDYLLTLTAKRSTQSTKVLEDLFFKELVISAPMAKTLNFIDRIADYDDLTRLRQYLHKP